MVDEPEPPSKLLVDVMMFAMDEQPPAALVVVSAEEGLANGLNKLSQRGYRVVLIRPPRAALSAALQGTAEAVLEWREVTGEEGARQMQREVEKRLADFALQDL